jgi:hypothetical protein
MPDPLVEARKRAQRFWYRDGLEEIVIGIIILLQNGFTLAVRLGNSSSSWYVPVILIYLLLIAAFALSVRRIKAAIRERITYPRSGYVDYGESVRKRRMVVGASAILATIATVLALRYAHASGWDFDYGMQRLPAVCGLMLGAVLVYVYVRYGLPRFLVVGLFSIILGVVVSIKYPYRLATVFSLAGVGCALLCSGGVTLWNYLRTAPPAADET